LATSTARAAAKAAISSSVTVSVAQTSSTSSSPAFGSSLEYGTPARMSRDAKASTTSAAGFGRRNANSLKNRGVSTSTPGIGAKASRKLRARAWLIRASCERPVPPRSVMCMVKASAQSPELVQMLLVAFSRRMCCSRVDSVSTKPRWPAASTVSPQRRPGIWRVSASRQAKSPT
jgi:hypothetical protein